MASGNRRKGSKIKRVSETIGTMGNCINPVDPLLVSLPRTINVDATPIKESRLPIIFLIGGPGAGKRTLCSRVAKKYGFLDIISTDLIRTEVSKRTDRAMVLARLMSQGRLIPPDVLVELITVKMLRHLNDHKGFIVSGFPRQKDQCKLFDREVRPPDLILYLNVRNSVLRDRILARRITTTERLQLNFDSIKNRIKKFHKRNRPIIKYYESIIIVIDGEPEELAVFEDVCKVIDDCLTNFPTTTSVEEVIHETEESTEK